MTEEERDEKLESIENLQKLTLNVLNTLVQKEQGRDPHRRRELMSASENFKNSHEMSDEVLKEITDENRVDEDGAVSDLLIFARMNCRSCLDVIAHLNKIEIKKPINVFYIDTTNVKFIDLKRKFRIKETPTGLFLRNGKKEKEVFGTEIITALQN